MAAGAFRYVGVSWSGMASKRVMVSTGWPSVRPYTYLLSDLPHYTERAQTTNSACRCHPKGALGVRIYRCRSEVLAATSVLRQA